MDIDVKAKVMPVLSSEDMHGSCLHVSIWMGPRLQHAIPFGPPHLDLTLALCPVPQGRGGSERSTQALSVSGELRAADQMALMLLQGASGHLWGWLTGSG